MIKRVLLGIIVMVLIILSSIIVIAPYWYGTETGLVGHWTCDGHFNDIISSNDGTPTSGVSIGPGAKGRGCSFNGTANVDMGDVMHNMENFSISAWVKTKDPSGEIAGEYNTAGGWIGRAAVVSGMFYFTVNKTSCGGVTTINDGQWHHVVGVFNRSNDTILCFVDGINDANATYSADAIVKYWDTNGHFGLGSRIPVLNYLNGSVDEVRVYNRSLTPAEILTLYNSTQTYHIEMYTTPVLGISNETPEPDTSDTTGLVGYWKFKESNPSYDYSGQNNALLQFAGDAGTANDNTNTTHIRETTVAQLSYTNDYYNSWTFEATSGAGDGETRTVIDYIYTDSSNKTIVLSSSISGFASGDTYRLYSDDSVGPDYVEGRFGNGYYFDGVDDHLLTGSANPSNANFFTDQVTISLWAKPTEDIANQYLWVKNGPFYADINSGGTLDIKFRNGTTTRTGLSNKTVNFNEWNHIVGRYNGTWITIYLNNELVNRTWQTGEVGGDSAWDFGRNNNGYLYGNPSGYFKGYMDEIRIYNRSLSESEITDLYLTKGLVGHWTFDTKDGSNSLIAPDISGYNNSGTVSGATFTNEGKFKEGYLFDGDNDGIVTTADIGNLSSKTISFWVNFKEIGTWGRLVLEATSFDSNKYVGLTVAANQIYLYQSRDIGNASYNAGWLAIPNITQWYHITGVINKPVGGMLIYANGVLVANNTFGTMPTSTFYNPPQGVKIGGASGSYYHNGTIDEVKIFNRALTTPEIVALYNGTKSNHIELYTTPTLGIINETPEPTLTDDSGLVGYWKFNTNSLDSSGNGHTGLIVGATNTSGRWNGGYSFDGNDYITISNNAFPTTENGTLSMWVYINDATDNARFFSTDDTGGNDCEHRTWASAGGTVTFLVVNDACSVGDGLGVGYQQIDSNAAFTTWEHVVWTWTYNKTANLTTLASSLNGVSQESGTFNGTAKVPDIALRLSYWAGNYYNGRTDEIRLYNRTLSSDEIKELYLSKGLVGHWKFNSEDGSNSTHAFDVSGYENTGIVTSATLTNEGKFKEGYEFDGSDDYISVGDDISLQPNESITYSSWVYSRDTANIEVINYRKNSEDPYTLYQMADSACTINLYDGSGDGAKEISSFNSVLSINTWHHVACTYSKADQELKSYIDGVLQTDVEATGDYVLYTNNTNLVGLFLGAARAPLRSFNGTIDEVKIFARALTTTEIAGLYNGTKSNRISLWSIPG